MGKQDASLPNHTDMEIPDWEEWLYAIVFTAGAFYMGFLLLRHYYYTYSDLYTSERKSVSHRRTPTKTDTGYKLAALFSCIHLFCNLMYLAIYAADFIGTHLCFETVFTFVAFGMFGKASLYSICFIRLHQVYGESAYGYSPKLLVSAVVLVNLGFALTLVWISTQAQRVEFTYDDDDKFPEFCIATLMDTSILVLLQDIIWTPLTLFLFLRPLKKAIRAMGDNITDKVLGKMVFIGTKVTILSCIAEISTFVFIIMIIFSRYVFWTVFDTVLNSYCIVYMTPYYPDDKHYKKACCCCIACCDRKHRSYEEEDVKEDTKTDNEPTETRTVDATATTTASTATTTDTQITATSVDTMDQVKVVADKTNPNNDQLLS